MPILGVVAGSTGWRLLFSIFWVYFRYLYGVWLLEVRAGDFYFQFLGVLPLLICGVVVGSTGKKLLFSILGGTSVTYLWGGRWKYGWEIVIFNSYMYFQHPYDTK